MLFVDNLDHHDATLNLALEEYILRNAQTAEDLLLFYINGPSIIIGRHQNTIEEINRDYVEQHGIQVVRRLSGGGAVYHDLGNLNFSFITEARPEHFTNFKEFTRPIIQALAKMGVTAELSGRNDILIDGRKVSGNAQYISKNRMVSHGTLLFNSDLSHVSEALHVRESKISSKGIKSVRSRVANIFEFLAKPMDILAFRSFLLENIFAGCAELPVYPVSAEDWQKVEQLAEERYRSWDWTYGNSPDFNIQKRERFPGGEIEALIDVQKGAIQSIKFFGDFFARGDLQELEKRLVGVSYCPKEIRQALQEISIDQYFAGMDLDTLITFLAE